MSTAAPPNPSTSAPPAAIGAGELSRTLGMVRVVSLDPAGRAVIEYAAGPHMCHSGGVVQGGFVTGWIDAAMAHAVIAACGADVVPPSAAADIVPMSLELKVSFFAPARPGVVTAEAWIEKRGRSTVFCEGRLSDAAGRVLAKASSTLTLMDRARVESAAAAAAG